MLAAIFGNTMKQQELLLLISKYLSRFSEQVKILNKNGEFSINIHAENVLIKILNIVFDVDLENVNYSEGKNYDTIDLRDKNGALSIQVTATSSITKIKDTLEGYLANEHYKKFKDLKVLVLTGRQEKYSQEAFDKIIQPHFTFDGGQGVIDLSTIYLLLNKQNELSKILAVKELLESQFSDVSTRDKIIEIDSFNKLCKTIFPYFQENGNVFKKFGPNSGADSKEPLRRDLTLWYKSRREIILPNNVTISAFIRENRAVIPDEHIKVFDNFLAHSYAFEKHCEDADFDYSEHQFPKEIMDILNEEVSKQ